jgi:hypothetical protein
MYDMLAEYEFVLMHHLDAMVFSDQLLEWCRTDHDYIGSASWWDPGIMGFRVGCGGFALRRVETFRKLFRSRRLAFDPEVGWENFSAGRSAFQKALFTPWRYLKRLQMFNGIERDLRDHIRAGSRTEDHFIMERAQHYVPGFRIAPQEVMLRFGFSSHPALCFRAAHGVFPFGVHLWDKYKDFWAPYILPPGGGPSRETPPKLLPEDRYMHLMPNDKVAF